jgi:DNA-binding GntR family transcriptional regulator
MPSAVSGKAVAGNDLQRAVNQLKREIQQGRFVPGQRLVEIDIMEHLGISRGRVREVYKRLEADGLVQIDKNRGASVRKVSRQEVENIFEVLEEISILMIKKVAQEIDGPESRAQLQETLAAAQQFRKNSANIKQVTAYMDENARFWGSLAAISGNPVLADVRRRLQAPLFRLAMEGLTIRNNREQWITRHEEIISAILEGDIKHATRHARKSMHDVWHAILELPETAFA